MDSLFETYGYSISALAGIAALMLIQLLVADVLGIVKRHIPGTLVPDDHSNLLFRATRTVSNTNESVGIFICLVLYCILSGASPDYTAYGAWAYVFSRLVYAACYYSNLKRLRSVCFGLSAGSLVALLLIGLFT